MRMMFAKKRAANASTNVRMRQTPPFLFSWRMLMEIRAYLRFADARGFVIFQEYVPSSVWRVTMPTSYAPRRATRVLPKKFFGSVIRVILTQRKREIEIGIRAEQGKITGRPTIGLEFIEEQLNACHANHGKDMKLQSHPIA
jgi:hypothetical protein